METDDRNRMAAKNLLMRIICSVVSFASVWLILSLLTGITIGTKLAMATLAAIAALCFGPKCWDWVTWT